MTPLSLSSSSASASASAGAFDDWPSVSLNASSKNASPTRAASSTHRALSASLRSSAPWSSSGRVRPGAASESMPGPESTRNGEDVSGSRTPRIA